MTPAEPLEQHKWLQQLVGEWVTELDSPSGPDQPSSKSVGTESVRSMSVWVLCEGQMSGPDGSPAKSLMTLGYDPARKKFVGTFVASMMTNLWTYEGELDEAGKVLTLDADGPSFTDPSRTAKYKDAIEIVSPDHRILTSRVLTDDGQWHQFCAAHYRRKA